MNAYGDKENSTERETNQQRDERLARRREYDRSRRAALSREQRRTINDVRRAQTQATATTNCFQY